MDGAGHAQAIWRHVASARYDRRRFFSLVEEHVTGFEKILFFTLFFYRYVRPRLYTLQLSRSEGGAEPILSGIEGLAAAQQILQRIAAHLGSEVEAVGEGVLSDGGMARRVLWGGSLTGLLAFCLIGSWYMGVPLGEVKVREGWSEVKVEQHLGLRPLSFWTETVVRGRAHSLERRKPSKRPQVVLLQIQVRQQDKLVHELWCDPLRVGWTEYSGRSRRRWTYRGPMVDCHFDRAPKGAFTVRTRLVTKARHDDVESVSVTLVPKI